MQQKTTDAIRLWSQKPNDESLRLHKLSGKMSRFYSIDITGDLRALYGIRRLDHHIRSVSRNYTRPAYILKLDFQGYFMSLERKKLYSRAMWGLNRHLEASTTINELKITELITD